MRITLSLVACLLVALLPAEVAGDCTCPQVLHFQNEFCHNDYDFILRVETFRVIPRKGSTVLIAIRTQAVYKTTAAYDGLRAINRKSLFHILTADKVENGKEFCAVKMKNNNKYLIAGRVINNKMWIFQCDWLKRWGKVSAFEKRSLKLGHYSDNCGCKVVHDTPVTRLPTEPSCPIFGSQSECGRMSYCRCRNDGCGTCKFVQSKGFNQCMSSVRVPKGK